MLSDDNNIIPRPVTCGKCKSVINNPQKFCPYCGRSLTVPERKHYKRANGTGSVYKLQGRRRRPWIATKNKVVLGYYETKKSALEALDRLTGTDVTDDYNLTFQQVYERWSAEHFPTVSESRQRVCKMAFGKFSDIHNLKFRDLRTADFQSCVDSAGIKNLSTLKVLINQMSKWAIQNQICTVNYAEFIRLPKQAKTEKPIFTQDEIQRLIQDDSDDAKIALMMIYTGMRIGELFGLTVEDYHGSYVIGGEKTEAGKNRIIPIAPQARPYFAEFASRSNDKLIRITSGVYRDYHYRPLLERLGIEYKSPHSCRHTFASMMAASGMDPNILKRIMGHADISTTANIYIHSDDDTLIHALDDFR